MSETRLCERCVKPFKSCFSEAMCLRCSKEKALEDIQNRILSGEADSTDYEDDVICPWCGEALEPDCEYREFYEDGTHVMQCFSCEKEFTLSTSVSYSYSTKRQLPVYVLRERELTLKAREKAMNRRAGDKEHDNG